MLLQTNRTGMVELLLIARVPLSEALWFGDSFSKSYLARSLDDIVYLISLANYEKVRPTMIDERIKAAEACKLAETGDIASDSQTALLHTEQFSRSS